MPFVLMYRMRSGKGTLTLNSGDRYEGSWLNDQKHGSGVYYYASKGKVRYIFIYLVIVSNKPHAPSYTS